MIKTVRIPHEFVAIAVAVAAEQGAIHSSTAVFFAECSAEQSRLRQRQLQQAECSAGDEQHIDFVSSREVFASSTHYNSIRARTHLQALQLHATLTTTEQQSSIDPTAPPETCRYRRY